MTDVRRQNKALENNVLKACMQVLHYSGLFHIKRNNSGKVMASYKGKSRIITLGEAGWPDIIGFGKYSGKFLGVECKYDPARKKKPTQLQKDFLELGAASGCYAVLAYGTEDLSTILELEGAEKWRQLAAKND